MIKKTVFFILITALLFSFSVEKAEAAGANIILASKLTAATVGEKFTVTLTIDTEEVCSAFEAYLSYSNDTAEYVSADDGIAGGKGILRINLKDMNKDEYTEEYEEDYGENNDEYRGIEKKYEIIFKAKKSGLFTLSFSDGVHVFSDTGEEMSVSSNTFELNVKNKREASADSSLSALRIAGFKLSPMFSKNTLYYEINVDKDTEKLVIGADPSDANSTVSVEGSGELKTGSNEVRVTVTAEAGNSTTYVVTVNKEDKAKKEKVSDGDKEKTDEKYGILSGKISEEKEYVPEPAEESTVTETENSVNDSKNRPLYGIIAGIAAVICILLAAAAYLKRKDKA